MPRSPIRTTSDRFGHLYDAARERLRDHLDATYATTADDAPLRLVQRGDPAH